MSGYLWRVQLECKWFVHEPKRPSLVFYTIQQHNTITSNLSATTMGNILFAFTSTEDFLKVGVDWSRIPPWLMLWPPFWMDAICSPLGCYDTWRDHVPYGLAEPGQWFSKEFRIHDVMDLLPARLSFEKFRTLQGYDVKEGSWLLAGVD